MRTKRTLLNMIFSVISLLISSVLTILLTRTVLVYLGSDYNGLNGTITQFLSVLMLFESGFTVAALVKLYKPFGGDDYGEINRILSKTKIKFRQIGWLMLFCGSVAAAVYALFIKTEVDYIIVVLMFLCSIGSTAFNFLYTYKYRLLFQVSQTEYIIYIVNIVQYVIMYSGMMVILATTKNIVFARAFYLLANILAGLAIGFIARRKFKKADYSVECNGIVIEGTKDLFISRLVGICYNSLTFFYMAVFVGTSQTSIYTVYNSVMSLIHNFSNVALNAPQNALGQILNSEKQRVKKTLDEYEYTSVLIISILLSVTMALYIPFIKLYTADVTDANYIQPEIALLLVLITLTQMIHIPSGKCIELSGKFKVVKTIQIITFVSLLILSMAGALIKGLMGLLIAKLITNIILASVEIGYAHIKVVEKSLKRFLLILCPNIAIAATLAFVEYKLMFSIEVTIIRFLICGILLLMVNSLVLVGFGRVFYSEVIKSLFNRVKFMIIRK